MSLKFVGQAGNWHAIKQIISAAALAGLIAGVCLTAVQQWQVIPLIHQAEVLEQAASEMHEHTHVQSNPADPAAVAAEHTHVHQHETAAIDGAAAARIENAPWQPADGFERLIFTSLANVSLAVGFGLLIGSVLYLHGGKTNWRAGLALGLAGYLVFFVAPSIGLPPELPGTEAAPVAARQLWWISTVASAGAGLVLLRFARLPLKLIGVVVLVLPFLVGAPHPPTATGDTPSLLAQSFMLATALANGAFWMILGALTAAFYKKYRG